MISKFINEEIGEKMIFKIANTEEEFNQIFKLNYKTFVDEIPQHEKNEKEILIDKFHKDNIYIIAKNKKDVVAMVSLCDKRPFSLDDKIGGIEKNYKGVFKNPIEIRLLSVKKEYRKSKVLLELLKRVYSYTIRNSYDIVFISGITKQEKLYNHIGFKRFYKNVGTKDAQYIPMFLKLNNETNEVFKNFNSGKIINYIPGPVDLSQRVIEKLHKKLYSHRSKQFVNLTLQTIDKLKKLLNVTDVTILHGSGTLANESILAQLSSKELNKGLILSNGEFGNRIIRQAKRHNLNFDTYVVDYSKSFDIDAIELLFSKNNYDFIYLVHHETSVGIINNLEKITNIAKKYSAIVAVDAISAVGGIKYDYSNVDYVACSSGKGIGSVAGLAIVGSNIKLVDVPKESIYLNLKYANENNSIPFTQPSLLMEALNEALNLFENDDIYNKILEKSLYMKEKISKINLDVLDVKQSEQSPIIMTIKIPNNISSKTLGDSLAINNILVHYNSKYLVEKNLIQFSFINKYTNLEEIDFTVDMIKYMLGDE